MKIKIAIYIIGFLSFQLSYSNQQIVFIHLPETPTPTEEFAAEELSKLLGEIYPSTQFLIRKRKTDPDNIIHLSTTSSFNVNRAHNKPPALAKSGAFSITHHENTASIVGYDGISLLYGVYALLEQLGYSFQLSHDVIPKPQKLFSFTNWEISDFPLKEERIIFNWHNFLSGCTGWDLDDWKHWIRQAVKLRFNAIMIHTYGNNPLNTFNYNGESKEIGYLSTTLKGRDWGTEHVNDVRRLTGGELFQAHTFGSNAALVADEDRSATATRLMQQVFDFADQLGLKIYFAFDIDTRTANPQNILATLPEESVITTTDGFRIANPETAQGLAFYIAQAESLLNKYPQVDNLCIWTRKFNPNPAWLTPLRGITPDQFPENWQKEYGSIMRSNTDLEGDLFAPSAFVIGKIIKAFQQTAKDINPDVEVSSGSWEFDFLTSADIIYPEDVTLIPLDFKVVFDSFEVREQLTAIGQNRKIIPIVWAHHDDHRYIGKPYSPFQNFNSKLDTCNSHGFGIIHWTTRPLDIYFKSLSYQVWQSGKNIALTNINHQYAVRLFYNLHKKMTPYLDSWIKNAPMFGRETSDHFMDPGSFIIGEQPESPDKFLQNIEERVSILNAIDQNGLSTQAKTMLKYYQGMEHFFFEFITQQNLLYQANKYWNEGAIKDTKASILEAEPEKAINAFANYIRFGETTHGEKAIVISLNLRWYPDFIDQKQLVRLESIRYNFQPTFHDFLAKAPGTYTFFIDQEKNWYLGLGEHEITGVKAFQSKVPLSMTRDSYIQTADQFEIPLRTIRQKNLSKGRYHLKLDFETADLEQVQIEIREKSKSKIKKWTKSNKLVEFEVTGNEVILSIDPNQSTLNLFSLDILPILD